ncbi:hypothetical protein [Hymenobacter defluvii]|uniref:Chitin-binding type-4 domain-containing protein n=1 Tax=Hymenobacter defluvii TaxID=2054411 RepID=A0ABS3TGL7_9BACT|nr:hypothetical protein [Hymenobacter defluvii]MBO3271875.1 hypothetical protein [Hymenobacter defluvii]
MLINFLCNMRLKYIVFAVVLLTGSACRRSSSSCALLKNDLESEQDTTGLTTKHAHSGHYSYVLPHGSQFGSKVFKAPLSSCGKIPRKIRASAQAYVMSGRVGTTMLVVSLQCHGRRPDVWAALTINEAVKRFQTWVDLKKTIEIPADALPTDEVQVYVWHMDATAEPTYFDDFKIKGYE